MNVVPTKIMLAFCATFSPAWESFLEGTWSEGHSFFAVHTRSLNPKPQTLKVRGGLGYPRVDVFSKVDWVPAMQ